ncbi:MAG: RecX family transcriptional regulator [Parasphingorhabdus sp.]|nr:RecX family transcriptional regulator [Parasphingorhabdus sp.]
MRDKRKKMSAKPFDTERLRSTALRYVERYATSRGKLEQYLRRKLRERGWEGNSEPPVAEIVEQFADLGYVNDVLYAQAKARGLAARGYGAQRLEQSLYQARINDEDAAPAREDFAAAEWDAARAFARKRRIGSFAGEAVSPEKRQKQLQAFLRAGHPFNVARSFVDAPPGEEPTRPE